MEYVSTRDAAVKASPSGAVLSSLAPGGGLFAAEEFPRAEALLARMGDADAYEAAKEIITLLISDLPRFAVEAAVEGGYRGRFDSEDILPMARVGEADVLELYHGPTCAFKDMALRILPRIMAAARERENDSRELLILTATSGDTGKAALSGFSGAPGTRILVFYPEKGVSESQRLQMVTEEGANVAVCAVRGDFDDAQRGVKAALKSLAAPGIRTSSANSINAGRLAPQTAYYFAAYSKLVASGRIKAGEPVDFIVPTGNFGNILSGYMAKRMGLPVGKLVCASNANDVLADFLESGVYDRRRALIKTASPSMDILVSSNLERLLFYEAHTGSAAGDAALVACLMERLASEGTYSVDAAMLRRIKEHFIPARADDAAAFGAIRRVFEGSGYLMDPHTAAAWCALEACREGGLIENPAVILSTASPYKFAPAMLRALDAGEAEGVEAMETLSRITGTAVPAPLANLSQRKILHRDVIDPDEITAYAERFAKGEK